MASLINLPNNFIFSSSSSSSSLPTTSNVVQVTIPSGQSRCFGSLSLSCSGVVSRPRKPRKSKVWENKGEEEDPDLEFDVFEYMKSSDKPNLFPTKEDLILGGRFDLVKRIVRQGGWLSFGWDLDDDEEEEKEEEEEDDDTEEQDEFLINDSRLFQKRFYGGGNGSWNEFEDGGFQDASSSYPPSSSGRVGGVDDSGIEGILTRLENQRSWSHGYRSKDEESKVSGSCNQDENEPKRVITDVNGGENSGSVKQSFSKDLLDDPGGMHTHSDLISCNQDENEPKRVITNVHGGENSGSVKQSFSKDLLDDPGGMHTHSDLISCHDVSSNNSKPDTWRNWSNRRAGCTGSEFEAAEFEEQFIQNDETVANCTIKAGNLRKHPCIGDKIKDYKQIKSRLQNLELELSSVLSLLSRKSDLQVSDKALKNSSEELQSLYDACEFRETEIMKARDKLRSLRAQVAVTEGKMALKVVQAQKLVELKQRKARYAQRALSLLRTASVTWHKSASEVLLAGSFDGWATQRRMKKSSPGIFSLQLKLYPGRYEIKFIVDGVWTIDPLRPVVNNHGHQNNLLIVS